MATYIIQNENSFKVGTSEDITRRLSNYRTHNPKPVYLRIESDYITETELRLHAHKFYKHIHGEWFTIENDKFEYLIEYIDNINTIGEACDVLIRLSDKLRMMEWERLSVKEGAQDLYSCGYNTLQTMKKYLLDDFFYSNRGL